MNDTKIIEENIVYLKQRIVGIDKKVDELLLIEDDQTVFEYETYDGQLGLYIQRSDGIIQLNSQYEAEGYAREWAEYICEREKLQGGCELVIYGLGNGSYLRALLEVVPKSVHIILYEPSIQVFLKVIRHVSLYELFGDRVDFFVQGFNMYMFREYWRNHMTLENGYLVHGVTIPNYGRVFKEEIDQVTDIIEELNISIKMYLNTRKKLGKQAVCNQLSILPYMLNAGNVAELYNALPDNYPAIVVAAGPSLKRNVKEIKKAKNKALIIAIDTSIKFLLQEDIIPDLYVTFDANKPLELFEDERVHNVPVCLCPYSVKPAFERQKNRIFISIGNDYVGRMAQQYNKKLAHFGAGGTVAQNAFTLAKEAGMNPIILVGQDLAFTDNETHALGAYTTQIKADEVDEKGVVWTEDIYGNPIKTQQNLMDYKRWYEVLLEDEDMTTRVIDATEGGARIVGTEICDLKDVIERECTRSFDFENAIASVPDLYTEEEKKELRGRISELPQIFHNMKRRTKEGADLYERLLTLSQRSVLDVKEIKKTMKQLSRISENVDHRLEYLLIELYVEDATELALTNLAYEEEDVKEDLKKVAERGIILMQAVKKAIPELLPELEAAIEKL